jgi:hypothetical protein
MSDNIIRAESLSMLYKIGALNSVTIRFVINLIVIRQTNNLRQEKTFKWTSRLSSLPTTEQR